MGLGFSGSFSANKFCRHCLSSKEQCRHFTSESECTLHTLESYDHSSNIIADSEAVNLDETDGVKFYCVLSDLKYFNIIENPTAETMHDVSEGSIVAFLEKFIKFCIEQNIFTFEELDHLVKSYDYGILNNKNVPSPINLNRRSLRQNAAQSMCLFRNLTFILYRYRNHPKLKEAWKCYRALLEICEIVSSYEITELEIDRLEQKIQIHLTLFHFCCHSNSKATFYVALSNHLQNSWFILI